MTNITANFDSISTTVDYPALRFAKLTGITTPANTAPDASDTGVVIPVRLTSYSGPVKKMTPTTIDTMPIVNPNDGGFAIGGKVMGYGSSELPKITMEGYIDTPSTETSVSGELLNLPAVLFNGMRVTYGDLIAAYVEGRANLQTTFVGGGISINDMWTRTNPTWFRDPMGRVYNAPKITQFTASYVEQVPGRTTFQMTLQVKAYGS